MDNRPIRGSSSGQYNLDFIDPTNDIPAYYDGMDDLRESIVTVALSRNVISKQ